MKGNRYGDINDIQDATMNFINNMSLHEMKKSFEAHVLYHL